MSTINDINVATEVAVKSLKELNNDVKDILVEEAIFKGENVEVTLSYIDTVVSGDMSPSTKLLTLLGERRKWRIFIIDKYTKSFKGFKAYHKDRA
ncbi:hypothetical protein ACU6Y6_08570 [Klebsiella aerogenes]